MPYVIARTGNTLKAVDASTSECRVFTAPTLRIYPLTTYPQAANPCVEIRQGSDLLQLTLADIISINGVAQATIGATLQSQLDALIAVPSGNLSATTSASGTPYVPFGSQVASQATIVNGTAVAIDVQRGGSGAAVSIAAGQQATFTGLSNTSNLGVRRTDQSTTQSTIGVIWVA